MGASNNIEHIKTAHKKGTLLAHMIEFQWAVSSLQMPDFLDVLSGVPGAAFHNNARHVESLPQGYGGLATTALKAGLPVPVWNTWRDVGLLFDAQDPQVKPLYVSSHDCYSDVIGSKLRITAPELKQHGNLEQIQGCAGKDFEIDMRHPSDLPAVCANALAALGALWENIASQGWKQAFAGQNESVGMNEVDVIAHIKGVRGLLVMEKDLEFPAQESKERFADAVKDALQLRRQVTERAGYSEGDLPIFAYDPTRGRGQLIALTPQQLAQPERFWERFHAKPSLAGQRA